ncbi:hemoglobin [Belliella buryatensis]|uniref:Hemoglobin n=1 Tax=Belliella buryatensis TaxID=1500549 RepID=A0A239DVS5_9BACT|nr:group III truncated hemoglobin [Belliella buryatensis]SNS36191.1 hemoglobin [Belliella buryatensis]
MISEKKEIKSREEVSVLVRNFYSKVRYHADLGPIFNGVVEDWEEHLERLTDFWEMILLQTGPGAGKFSPVPVHKEVDRQVNHQLEEQHFLSWLGLWFETVEEYFEGEAAEYAKVHAERMAHILFFRIMENRKLN